MAIAVVPAWVLSVRKVSKDLPKERLPLLGIGAAFSFLIMMLNVPLPGGTTGHASGGALLAILLGPFAACISISIALLVQALVFGDGGILSFGANCFNMAFVVPFLGYLIYRLVKSWTGSKTGEFLAISAASYLAINFAALCAAVEFGLQPLVAQDSSGLPLYCPYPLSVTIPAMVLPHLALAGIVEAAFTVAIVAFIRRTSPGTMYAGSPLKLRPLYALAALLVLASPLGLLASGSAWGEWDRGSALGFTALIPDYSVEGAQPALGYLFSAAIGASLLVILFKLLGLIRKPGTKKPERETPQARGPVA
jgi:cobalt/nickel transport system permease protein